VEDLDRQVLLGLAEDVLGLLLDDRAGAMMGVDDGVADLEVDALGLDALQVVQQLLGVDGVGGNGSPPLSWLRLKVWGPAQVCR
jgi:hypothetical protein